MPIHPSAVVHDGAEIDSTADIGPYCIVGPHVTIGPDTRLVSHVVIENDTSLGARNVIHPFAVVGGPPQDLKFGGERSRLVIGDDNVIRESVTLNIGTESGHMETRVGSNCLLMAFSHVAHDCHLGDRVILANSVALAGHVTLGDFVTVGGLVGIHQFCRVGHHAFLGGGAMVAQDVPPFCIAQGDRAQLVGLNVVGLKRAGWSRERLGKLREGYKSLFHAATTRMTALEHVETELARDNPDVAEMCAFIRSAQRGVCQPRLAATSSDSAEG